MAGISNFGFIHHIGPFELVIILVVVLLLFGAKRLPELARGLGKSMTEFKKATQEVQDDFREAVDNVDPNKPSKKAGNSGKAPPAPKAEADEEDQEKATSQPRS